MAIPMKNGGMKKSKVIFLVVMSGITTGIGAFVGAIIGGISEEDWFINKVREQYKKSCIEYLGADFITTKIDRCKYNNDANILGAIINASIKR